MIKYLVISLFPLFAFQTVPAIATNSGRPYTQFQLLDSSKFQDIYISTLKEMTPSFVGKTSQGNSYNLFAIKRTKGWNLLILDSTGYYSFYQAKVKKKDKEKKDGLTENNASYTNMLCMMAQAKLLKKINKPKNVSGLTFTCYYKFRPQARKMYRSFIRIQGRAKFFETNLKDGPDGKKKIFKSLMK